jgi:hypothetical protein
MALLLLMCAYLVGSAALAILAGKAIARRDAREPARPVRELTRPLPSGPGGQPSLSPRMRPRLAAT